MKLIQKLSAHAVDLALIFGSVLIAVGVWMVYPPAGLMAAGALMILGGVVSAKDTGGDGA